MLSNKIRTGAVEKGVEKWEMACGLQAGPEICKLGANSRDVARPGD